MSDAANVTSTDNNGDSGLNGKLNVTKLLVWNSLSVCFLSEERVEVHNCMFILCLLRVLAH